MNSGMTGRKSRRSKKSRARKQPGLSLTKLSQQRGNSKQSSPIILKNDRTGRKTPEYTVNRVSPNGDTESKDNESRITLKSFWMPVAPGVAEMLDPDRMDPEKLDTVESDTISAKSGDRMRQYTPKYGSKKITFKDT